MLAQEEARRLGHNFVGTEQILLGLIGESTGIAAKVLKSMGVNLKDARVEVEKIIGRGSGFVAVEIPFTPRAKRVLELSLEEARQLGARRAPGADGEGAGRGRGRGSGRSGVRRGAVGRWPCRRIGRSQLPRRLWSSRLAAPQRTHSTPPPKLPHSRAHPGHNYIGTEHILLGLLREGEGVAARVLETLGADPSKIRTQVRVGGVWGAQGRGPRRAAPGRARPRARACQLLELHPPHTQTHTLAWTPPSHTHTHHTPHVFPPPPGHPHGRREPGGRRRGRRLVHQRQQQDADAGGVRHQPHAPGGGGQARPCRGAAQGQGGGTSEGCKRGARRQRRSDRSNGA